MNEIMTVAELAEYLRVNEATVYRLAQEGQIPGMKVGRQWRFKKDAIDRLLEEGADLAPEAEKAP
ncbi:MAG: helix-turn-helix domain-containing protein, partial [Anaerolineae bacterium]